MEYRLSQAHRFPLGDPNPSILQSHNALVQAGILEDGTRRMVRGTQCIAKDGHVYLSLGERTKVDLPHAHGIPHEKEPHYPESNYRADFAVGDVFIEFFGLAGNLELAPIGE